MLRTKLAGLCAEEKYEEMRKSIESLKLQNQQLESFIAQYEAERLRFAEEISNREDAVARRERARNERSRQAAVDNIQRPVRNPLQGCRC